MTEDVFHPRPQLRRAAWEDLGGTWGFAYDDDERGLGDGWHDNESAFDREIVVPFPPESELSGISWNFSPAANVPEEYAQASATPFQFDITDQLAPDAAEQVVVVRAEDRPTDVTQPRGKQDWRPEPHVIWYHRTTGIWQPVWIEQVPQVHVAEVHWTPDLGTGSVTMELGLSRLPIGEECKLRVKGALEGGPFLAADDIGNKIGMLFQQPVVLRERFDAGAVLA